LINDAIVRRSMILDNVFAPPFYQEGAAIPNPHFRGVVCKHHGLRAMSLIQFLSGTLKTRVPDSTNLVQVFRSYNQSFRIG
jgi:hypothetical protein